MSNARSDPFPESQDEFAMQIDVKTVNIEPKRKAFDHLVARFGDKPASRYQEGSYDIQATENLHYRPTWAPEQELYDPNLSRVRMADWNAFKDPRQYFYSTYVLARARQQEAAEGAFTLVETRALHATIPDGLKQSILDLLVPLRHAAWGANQNNVLIAGYGYGTPFTQPCLYQGMDCLAVAQYISRIGLLLGGTEALATAKQQWVSDEVWQPLRRLVEDRDPFELFIVQNIVIDGLLYPTVFDAVIDGRFALNGAAPVSMLAQFITDWSAETRKWADSVVKIAAGESTANAAVIAEWFAEWSGRTMAALLPPIGSDADALLGHTLDELKTRLSKAGVQI
jgi:phenol/toluene 2-monooxygenase (NADH) P1/A1